jgi:hypothetical protein
MACWSATASAIEGVDQLWALKSRIDIPLAHVTDAVADPEAVRGWKGWRGPGAHAPGVIVAGTFHHQGDRVFWVDERQLVRDPRPPGHQVKTRCCTDGPTFREPVVSRCGMLRCRG